MLIEANAYRIPFRDGVFQCCVTSPPYWGHRKYLDDGHKYKAYEIGLEPTPELYVEHLVSVFREVRRVLRDDGTVWLNLGDSYCSGNHSKASNTHSSRGQKGMRDKVPGLPSRPSFRRDRRPREDDPHKFAPGLKPKDLVGIPWRVAFALQADGWWLRLDVIWHKPNCMPESVTDRPTKAHEYVFLLTKSARYYYDNEAIRERGNPEGLHSQGYNSKHYQPDSPYSAQTRGILHTPAGGRNRRSVWTIPTQPYAGAHFATFPEKLVEPCILAGTSARGECPVCGKAWRRVVEKSNASHDAETQTAYEKGSAATTGWLPQCNHAVDPIPQTVLDPFSGSGTTGCVAIRHRRRFVGLELNSDYITLAEDRTRNLDVRLGL